MTGTIIHGYASIINGKRHELYNIWNGIKQRCLNPKNKRFRYYGGRGIIVCDRWKEFKNFVEDILSEIGDRPGNGHSIDRINNDGNYEPGNVKWSTSKEQNNNKRPIHKSQSDIFRCNMCGRFLGRNSFHNNKYRATTCKRCLKVQGYLWRLDNPEYNKRYNRRWRGNSGDTLDIFNEKEKERKVKNMKKYTETILARVTPEVKEAISKMCEDDDRTESNFIRRMVDNFIKESK